MDTEDLQRVLEQWRAEMADRPLQSAQHVQDKLLDIYGTLRELPVKIEVEKWLSLTRERSLFEDKEISELLDEIEMELSLGAIETDMEPAGA
jgi:hypothetical protein